MHVLMFLSIQQKAIVQLGSCTETNLLKTEIGNPNHSRTATGNVCTSQQNGNVL